MISITAGQDSATDAIASFQHDDFTAVTLQDRRGPKS
jgi:hypothetical protein